MKPALVDVAVLILFFNRPRQLAQVFEQVKKARPSRLFLYQDGPRGEKDLPGSRQELHRWPYRETRPRW